MIESLIFSIHFHLGVDYWSDLIIILLFDPSFIIFFPLFSPLSFLYKCVNLFGCSWILRFISLFVWGFVFCAVWPVKSWCYSRGRAWTVEERASTSGLWNTWPHVTWIGKSPPQNIHLKLRPSPTQKAASSSASCPRPILQKNRNTTLHISGQAAQSCTEPIDNPKHMTGHGTALQKDWTQLHPPEHRHVSPTRKPS